MHHYTLFLFDIQYFIDVKLCKDFCFLCIFSCLLVQLFVHLHRSFNLDLVCFGKVTKKSANNERINHIFKDKEERRHH